MPQLAIRTTGLTRRFGGLVAVNNLTFDIPLGGVIGMVGPNGSGKLTTIRMLLGLIRPSTGTAEVLGGSIMDPSQYAHRVGALIENPAFVPSLSARRNIALLATLRGLPAGRVDEVLRIVGLTVRANDAVWKYSLRRRRRVFGGVGQSLPAARVGITGSGSGVASADARSSQSGRWPKVGGVLVMVPMRSRRIARTPGLCGRGASPGMGTVAAWVVAHAATSVFLVTLGDRCSGSSPRENPITSPRSIR